MIHCLKLGSVGKGKGKGKGVLYGMSLRTGSLCSSASTKAQVCVCVLTL